MTPAVPDLTILKHRPSTIAVEPDLPESSKSANSSHVWLVTFSDLVLLLLTFLVLLFAMSEIDLGRYGAMSRSTGITLTEPVLAETRAPSMDFAIPQKEVRPGEDLGFLKAVITDALSRDSRFGQVATRLTDEYLVLSLPGALLFQPGSAEIGEDAKAAIFDIAGLLNVLDNAIAVTGYVGPAQLESAPFLSAWELSLARAAVVSRNLRDFGYAGPLTVLGRGNVDFVSRTQDLPEFARIAVAAAADRVDIVIFSHKSGV